MSIPVSTLTGSNTINQMMYNVNTIKDLAANSASSLTGPGSSTDNAVVRFDGTSGLTAQNSGVTIADDNSMIISGSSSGDMLRITQTGAGNALLVEDSTNPDSTPFVIDASGNVGIGLTPTTNKLEVAGTIESTGLVSTGGASITSTLDITTNNTAFRLKDSAGTMIPTLFLSASNQLLFGTYSAPASSGDVIFMRAGTERMRLDGTGFGIGTTSPAVELDIVGNKASSVANRVYNQSTSAGSQSMLSLQTGSANHLVNIVMNDNTGSGYFQFSSDTGVQAAYYDFAQHIFRSQGGAERMRIDSSGNTGIGTSSPSATLEVAGTPNATIQPSNAIIKMNSSGGNGLYMGNLGAATYASYIQSGYVFADSPDVDYNLLLQPNGGNVGIGTSIPDKRLHVLSTDVNGGVAVFENTSSTQYATGGIIVKNGASSSGKHVLIGTAVRDVDGSDSVFTINRVNDDASLTFDAGLATYDLTADFWTFKTNDTERLRIDSSGLVGIGRTPTTNLLEVAGTIESTSGGFKFPDGSTQTSAASAGITTGKAIAMAIVFG